MKNPNITLWLDFIQETKKEHIANEIEYSINDAFKEFDDLKMIALESVDQYGRPNIAAANKAVEMKCRLKQQEQLAAIQQGTEMIKNMGGVDAIGAELAARVGM